MKHTLAMILAGGKGERLAPLTDERAKPAVPFGGKFRIIDFVLSNMVNSGIHEIVVLSQYESRSLEDHIRDVWTSQCGLGQAIYTLPPRSGKGRGWYQGTADSISQNIDRISKHNADRVAIFSGDHVYRMDVSKMIEAHNGGNDLTIAALKTPVSEDIFEIKNGKKRCKFGIIQINKNNNVVEFQEKPEKPSEIPGQPGYCLVSMGNYIFKKTSLLEALEKKFHDFGNHIIPEMKKEGKIIKVYPFEGYWRDVGDIDSYFRANMDLNGQKPKFNLFEEDWPVRTLGGNFPPTYLGICNSLVSEGCIVHGTIENCILSPGVSIGKNSHVQDAIIFNNTKIGNDVRIRKAVIDKCNYVKSGDQIGYNSEEDKARGFHITSSGIVVVPRRKLK